MFSIKRWPDYLLAQFPNTIHSMITARLNSERPGSVIPLSRTFSLLVAHPQLQQLWAFSKQSKNTWLCVHSVSPPTNSPFHPSNLVTIIIDSVMATVCFVYLLTLLVTSAICRGLSNYAASEIIAAVLLYIQEFWDVTLYQWESSCQQSAARSSSSRSHCLRIMRTCEEGAIIGQNISSHLIFVFRASCLIVK